MSDIDKQAEVLSQAVSRATRLLTNLKEEEPANPAEGFLALTIALAGLARAMDISAEDLKEGVEEAYLLVEVRNGLVQ